MKSIAMTEGAGKSFAYPSRHRGRKKQGKSNGGGVGRDCTKYELIQGNWELKVRQVRARDRDRNQGIWR